MIIGITGAIASGKSQILLYIKKKGYKVISLDEISHKLFDEEEVNKKIIEKLGISDITEEKVSRARVREIVFNDKDKLNTLNNILHPLILEAMSDKIKDAREKCENLFIEVPLLYELDMASMFDKVIFIYVKRDIQIERLMERENIGLDEAELMIKNQIDVEEKKRIAMDNNHYIVNNDGVLLDTYSQLNIILGELYETKGLL